MNSLTQHYVNGKFIPYDKTAPSFENINPVTQLCLSNVPIALENTVNLAVESAQMAFKSWAAIHPQKRAHYLKKIGDEILNMKEELALAECLDTGKPLSLARQVDIPRSAKNFHFFSELLNYENMQEYFADGQYSHLVKRFPLGVVAIISPWNLPLYLLTWKIAPALISGNCVVAKPSELTPTTAFLLCKIFDKVGLPKGVCNIIHGTGNITGQLLVEHPGIKAISFTGSTKTGEHLAKSASKDLKKISLEMGGKNPAIIFKDCDIDKAVETTVRSSFSNQGQICLCTSRVLVEESIYDTFKLAFKKKIEELKAGNPLEPDTQIGYLISKEHAEKVKSFLDLGLKNGGIILTGGEWKNLFLKPTVIENLSMSDPFNQTEIFGPLISLCSFNNIEEAIKMANDSCYGLCSTIWTKNLENIEKMNEELDTGMIWINEWMIRDLRTPFGGTKKSGFGKEGGLYAIDFFTKTKTITLSI